MYGRSDAGKSCILSRILFDRLDRNWKGILPEGIYYYGNKKILLLESSMEESRRNIEKVLKECTKNGLDFDILLIAAKMYMINKQNATINYLVNHFDTRLFVLNDWNQEHKLPYMVPTTSYKIEGIVNYEANNNNFRQKVDITANSARNLI